MQFLIFINFSAALQGVFLTYLIAHNRTKDTKSKTPVEKIQFDEFIFLSEKVPFQGLLMQLVRVVYLGVYAMLSKDIYRK